MFVLGLTKICIGQEPSLRPAWWNYADSISIDTITDRTVSDWNRMMIFHRIYLDGKVLVTHRYFMSGKLASVKYNFDQIKIGLNLLEDGLSLADVTYQFPGDSSEKRIQIGQFLEIEEIATYPYPLHGQVIHYWPRIYCPDSNMCINFVEEFENGLLNGSTISYYPTGEVQKIEKYENGKLSGCIYEYYLNGNLMSTSSWKDGKRIGPSCFFNEFGVIKGYQYYKDGIPDKFFEVIIE